MATPLSTEMSYVSGVTWFDIVERKGPTPKTLLTITEADWITIGGFREGTFNFTGDEMTITEQKYENGQNITSTVQDGTYGFEGDLANIAKAITEKLLRTEPLVTTGATTGAFIEGRDVVAGGKNIGILDNVFVRLRFEDSPKWHSLIYLNAKLASRITGAGASTDLVNIHINTTTAKSTDLESFDQIYVLVGKEGSAVTP